MAAKLYHQDFFYEYYTDHLLDIEVSFRKNKVTGEIHIGFNDEMAQKIFGFESVEKMMRDPKIIELINLYFEETGQKLFTIDIPSTIHKN